MGTPRYMAPEQYLGEADARSDQFSFCVALYEALYRQLPFAGDSVPELRASIELGRVLPPPDGSQVPARLFRALKPGLNVAPACRHRSMDELLSAVSKDPSWRRLRIAAVSGGALLLAGALATTLWATDP